MVIGFVTKLVKTITLSRVAIWTLAAAIALVGYTAFENRETLFDSFGLSTSAKVNPVGQTFTLSDSSKSEVKTLISSDSGILAVAVLTADIRLNVRHAIYFQSVPSVKVSAEQQFKAQAVQRLPLFTNDPENNRQIVKLINGEFHCVPYLGSALSRAAPTLNKNVVSVCRSSMPAYYGYFSGFISVFMSTDPDIDRQFRLRTELESLSTRIYLRDIVTTSRTVPF